MGRQTPQSEVGDLLVRLIETDARVRARLAADGSLFDGYNPEMEAIHRANAAALLGIVEAHGWPGRRLAGDAGADAAWRIAQHAIGEPSFMRQALVHVTAAVAAGDAPAWQPAYLEDRIRALEGHPQRYGTQYDWDEHGEMSPYPEIEDLAGVDERRRTAGLGSLDENTARMRAGASAEKPPVDLVQRRRAMDEWARRVGWRGKRTGEPD